MGRADHPSPDRRSGVLACVVEISTRHAASFPGRFGRRNNNSGSAHPRTTRQQYSNPPLAPHSCEKSEYATVGSPWRRSLWRNEHCTTRIRTKSADLVFVARELTTVLGTDNSLSAFPVHALWTIKLPLQPDVATKIRSPAEPQSPSTPAQCTSATASCFPIPDNPPQFFSSHAPKILN